MKRIVLFIGIIFCFACCNNNTQEDDIRKCINVFTQGLVSYNLSEAASYSTDDYKKRIQFIASNLTEEDINTLNKSAQPSFSIEDIEIDNINMSAKAVVEATDWMRKDALGDSLKLKKSTRMLLYLTKEGNKWLIRKADLLRNEMPDRD